MHIHSKAVIHNRFDIHTEDIITGEKQQFHAHNIILNQAWAGSVPALNSTGWSAIRIGRGAGTLDPARTSLFSHIAQIWDGVVVAQAYSSGGNPAQYTKKFEIALESYVGETITEVGAMSSGGVLTTHAFLEDAEGNIISLTKTSTMIVTIYSTVFFSIIPSVVAGTIYQLSQNVLERQFLGLGSFVGAASCRANFHESRGPRKVLINQSPTRDASGANSSPSLVFSGPWSWTQATKVWQSPVVTMPVATGNGHVFKGVTFSSNDGRFAGVQFEDLTGYAQQVWTGVALGSGNGVKTIFPLPSLEVDPATIDIYVNNVLSDPLDYTIHQYPQLLRLNPTAGSMPSAQKAVGWLYDAATEEYMLFIGSTQTGTDRLTHYRIYPPDGTEKVISATGFTIGTNITSISVAGDHLVVVGSVAPTFSWYKKKMDAGVRLEQLANPPDLPTGSSGLTAVRMLGDFVVVAGTQSSQRHLTTYTRSGDVLTRVQTFKDIDSSVSISHLAIDPTGFYIAVSAPSLTGPLRIYKRSSIDNTLSLLPDPTGVPTGPVQKCAWFGDYLAVVGNTGLFKWFKRSGDTFTELSAPSGVPSSDVYGVAWHPSGDFLVIGTRGTGVDRIVTFLRTGDTLVKSNAPIRATTGTLEDMAFSPDGKLLGVCAGGGDENQLSVLQVVDDSYTEIEFDTAPADTLPVTADFNVNGIHKTANWTVGLSWSIQFGEPTP